VKSPSSKKPDTKTAAWSTGKWKVVYGELKRGRGNPGKVSSVFHAIGEKIPKDALGYVESTLKVQKLSAESADGCKFENAS